MWTPRVWTGRRVMAAGVAEPELTAIETWAARRGLDVVRIELDEPLTPEEPNSALSLALFDARKQPILAIIECARINAVQESVPLMMIGHSEMESAALRAGVSVYLTFPVATERLLGYADRLVPASQRTPVSHLVPLGERVHLNVDGACLVVNGLVQHLTPDCFRLLTYLVANPGRIITAQELVRQGLMLPSQSARFRAVICELRKQLGEAAECIRLVRGYGYRFELPAQLGGSTPVQCAKSGDMLVEGARAV